MIKVENTVKVYEINSEETSFNEEATIKVNSHWNRYEWVVVEIEGKKYTVKGSDLISAVSNATNTNRY